VGCLTHRFPLRRFEDSMRCPAFRHRLAVDPHAVGCPSECYKQRSCKRIRLLAPATTSLFPESLRSYSATGPRPIARSGSSSRELCLHFRVSTASNLPHTRTCVTPSLGFASLSRHQQKEATSKRESQLPLYAPPTAFLTLTTVCSAFCLAGLFHPAATSGIDLSRVFSRYQGGPPHRRPRPS